jgi:hypothetical protein
MMKYKYSGQVYKFDKLNIIFDKIKEQFKSQYDIDIIKITKSKYFKTEKQFTNLLSM